MRGILRGNVESLTIVDSSLLISPLGAHDGAVTGNVDARFEADPFVAGIDRLEVD